MNPDTTPTPLTDRLEFGVEFSTGEEDFVVYSDEMRKLERANAALRAEVERLQHEIKTDSWTREMQEALQAIPSQFVQNDYWVNGIKRMAAEIERLNRSCTYAEFHRIKQRAERATQSITGLIDRINEIGLTAKTAYKYSNDTRCTAHVLSIMEQVKSAIDAARAATGGTSK